MKIEIDVTKAEYEALKGAINYMRLTQRPPLKRSRGGDVSETERERAEITGITFDGERFIFPCRCSWDIPGDGWLTCNSHPHGNYPAAVPTSDESAGEGAWADDSDEDIAGHLRALALTLDDKGDRGGTLLREAARRLEGGEGGASKIESGGHSRFFVTGTK